MSLALFSDIVPATFRTVFVPGPALRPGPGHISGCFCSRPSLPAPSRPRLGLYLFPAHPSDPSDPARPRLGPFLFPDLLSDSVPATFGALFVPSPALRPRPSHVWGCVCSRPCLPTPPQPRLMPFLFPALLSCPVPATFGAVFVPGRASDPAPATIKAVFVPGPAIRPRPGHVWGRFCGWELGRCCSGYVCGE